MDDMVTEMKELIELMATCLRTVMEDDPSMDFLYDRTLEDLVSVGGCVEDTLTQIAEFNNRWHTRL